MLQAQKELITSIHHRSDSSNKRKFSQTRLVLRCENCGGLPKSSYQVLQINDCGLCTYCQEFLDIRGIITDFMIMGVLQ